MLERRDRNLMHLFQCLGGASIREIDASFCSVTTATLAALPMLPALESLNLDGCQDVDDEAVHLTSGCFDLCFISFFHVSQSVKQSTQFQYMLVIVPSHSPLESHTPGPCCSGAALPGIAVFQYLLEREGWKCTIESLISLNQPIIVPTQKLNVHLLQLYSCQRFSHVRFLRSPIKVLGES